MDPRPETPASPDDPSIPVAVEVAQTASQAALGIDYTEVFTLKQAVDSYNATRQAYTDANGREVTAADQRLALGDDWFMRYAGTFKLRRAGWYDELAMRVRRDQLAGPRPDALSAVTSWLLDATVVAETLLVEAPSWFKLADIEDTDVLLMIHHWHGEWSARFRRTLPPAP